MGNKKRQANGDDAGSLAGFTAMDDTAKMMTEPFLAAKGFDLSTKDGINAAMKWLKNARPTEMFYSEESEDADEYEIEFDSVMGNFRRSAMIRYLEGLQKMI